VDFAGSDLQVDLIVGDDAWIAFGYVPHFECGYRFWRRNFFGWCECRRWLDAQTFTS
jgi:hypothetical protein